MSINKPVLLTVREAAHILRIQRTKVYILISIGTLKAVKVGADWRIRTDSLESLAGEIPAEIFASLRTKASGSAVKKSGEALYLNGTYA